MELLEIEDAARVDEPRTMGEYVPRLVPGLRLRDDLKPLEISQPEGASFTLDGNLLRWQRWSLRVGFNHREGMVLHTLGYDDGGRTRPVAHRLSFAEMVVPYRDPTPDHYRRTAFDIGEWGLGFMTTSLELGCDCLGEIAYLDAVLHDTRGEPYAIRNAICIHEEDNAVLWKHVDPRHGAEVRRQRRLVLSFHVTVANYEYLVYWRLYQDGNIECEVRATGIMVTTHFADGRAAALRHARRRAHLRAVPPALPHRAARPRRRRRGQHGLRDRVRGAPGRRRTTRTASRWCSATRRCAPSSEGRQDYDWHTQRAWKVVNEHVANGLGTPVGYKLVPGRRDPADARPRLAGAAAAPRRSRHTLWVTPFDADERWPCGEFVVQSRQDADAGLPGWTARDRSIEDTDVVLWYVFGIHHITRPEEWPVMSVDTVSFWLKPVGFFDRNPALDVAPAHRHCHPEESG